MGPISSVVSATRAILRDMPDPGNMGGFIDNHDMKRFMTTSGKNKESLKLALIHLYTHTSIPIVYYGTEIAMQGGDDPLNRAFFPWETYTTQNPDVFNLVKTLNKLRHEQIALRRGTWQELLVEKSQLAFARVAGASKVVVVINNDANQGFKTDLAIAGKVDLPDGTMLDDQLSGKTVKVTGGTIPVELGARQAAIYTVKPGRPWVFPVAVGLTVLAIGGALLAGRLRKKG